jgi:hypothetical protein
VIFNVWHVLRVYIDRMILVTIVHVNKVIDSLYMVIYNLSVVIINVIHVILQVVQTVRWIFIGN